jgi:hypothetical protein
MLTKKIFTALLGLSLLVSCKERFMPDLPSPGTGYLIVEGNLNAGNDSTVLSLTRSYSLDGNALPVRETNAAITVEGADGSTQTLQMTLPGIYRSLHLNLTPNTTYNVRIKTKDGKEYLSDPLSPLTTPVIDSVGWKRDESGIQFYANAQGANNSSKYYRWEYDETWQINSYYKSFLVYDPPVIRDRLFPQEDRYTCWKYDTATSIIIGSSAALSSNLVYQQPLLKIPQNDERLAVRYSLMVKQYSVTKDAYEFYEIMKKNTESLGTLFDAQPSELRGNIRCINDDQSIVIGYITASSVERKRIFVSNVDNWNYRQNCETVNVTPDSIVDYFDGEAYIPLEKVLEPNGTVRYYTGAISRCVDCTRRNGNLSKPSYW